jgi:hypothetical protein
MPLKRVWNDVLIHRKRVWNDVLIHRKRVWNDVPICAGMSLDRQSY